MDNPYQAPQWPEGNFRDQVSSAPIAQGQGLVGHVRAVSILMIVHGSLLLLVGGLLAFYAVFIPLIAFNENNPQTPDLPFSATMLVVGFGLGASVVLFAAGLQIWGGIQTYKFRGRRLAITGLSLGLVSALTCYCAPTSIGLAIYGLIVFLNYPVAAAFRLGEQGYTAHQILAGFYSGVWGPTSGGENPLGNSGPKP